MKTAKKIKIFLVDDDNIFANALKHSLIRRRKYSLIKKEKQTFEIKTFSTGEECIKNLRDNPEIIVLDYFLNTNLPNAMNGIEVLKKIKLGHPHTEVIMLSAQDNIDIALNTIKHGAYDYITKTEGAFVKINNMINKIGNSIEFATDIDKEEKRFRRISIGFIIVFFLLFLISRVLNSVN